MKDPVLPENPTQDDFKQYMKELESLLDSFEVVITKVISKDQYTEDQIKELK